jgi:hypothetical protein
MLEKMPSIRNPLSTIALFAGLSEISGTVVLPFINTAGQSQFLWFLMLFPTFLVLLFFLTLWFRHGVLYAPSDYRDEGNFLKSFDRASFEEVSRKIEHEVKEQMSLETADTITSSIAERGIATSNSHSRNLTDSEIEGLTRDRYRMAEDLVLKDLAIKYKTNVAQGVTFNNLTGKFIFDGTFEQNGELFLVEVKYFRSFEAHILIRHLIGHFFHGIDYKKFGNYKKVSLILTLVFNKNIGPSEISRVRENLNRFFKNSPIPIISKIYFLDIENESIVEKDVE